MLSGTESSRGIKFVSRVARFNPRLALIGFPGTRVRNFTNENPILPIVGQSEFPGMPNIAIDHNGWENQPIQSNWPWSHPCANTERGCTGYTSVSYFYIPTINWYWHGPQGLGTCKHNSDIQKGISAGCSKPSPSVTNINPLKILKHIIFHHIMAHLDEHNILVDY